MAFAAFLASALSAFSDPSAKPTGQLKLPQRLGDCNDCSLTASPIVLSGEKAWVDVDIVGVSYATRHDWVGAFAPEDLTASGQMLKFPIRWQWAHTSCGPRGTMPSHASCVGEACCMANNYTTQGSAALRFQLVNLRSSYVFALVQGSTQYPLLAATSKPPVGFARPAEPTQVHVALSGKPEYLSVSWTTANVTGLQSVRWGLASTSSSAGFTHAAPGTYKTYGADEMCVSGGPAKGPGFRDPGLLWSAVMGPLQPGVQYAYTVGSATAGWSHQRAGGLGNFTVRGPARPDAPSVRIVAFGDMGKAPSAWDGKSSLRS